MAFPLPRVVQAESAQEIFMNKLITARYTMVRVMRSPTLSITQISATMLPEL